MTVQVGVIGEFRADNDSHVATNDAISHSAKALATDADVRWIPTDEVAPSLLESCDAIFSSPGSPYRSIEGALEAIRYARDNDVPWMGTCAGFQHAVLEIARDLLGIGDAAHAEYGPRGTVVVTPLECSLRGQTLEVSLLPGSRAQAIYGAAEAMEEYRCSFGLNGEFREPLESAGVAFSGVDPDREPRILELPAKKFFVGTLFVPQLQSTPERPHPLVTAFLEASGRFRPRGPSSSSAPGARR